MNSNRLPRIFERKSYFSYVRIIFGLLLAVLLIFPSFSRQESAEAARFLPAITPYLYVNPGIGEYQPLIGSGLFSVLSGHEDVTEICFEYTREAAAYAGEGQEPMVVATINGSYFSLPECSTSNKSVTASGTVMWRYELVGPVGIGVPLKISYRFDTSVSGKNSTARARLDYYDGDYIYNKAYAYCNSSATGTDCQALDEINRSCSPTTGSCYPVPTSSSGELNIYRARGTFYIKVHASGGIELSNYSPDGFAQALADPFLTIDPTAPFADQFQVKLIDKVETGVLIDPVRTPIDWDLDGYKTDTDCNDDDPAIHPRAEDTLDGIDNNCDGAIDGIFSMPWRFNPVTLDGVVSPGEWTNAKPYFIFLDKVWGWPDRQVEPSAKILTARFQNDGEWLYALYQLPWAEVDYDPLDGSMIELFCFDGCTGYDVNDNGAVSLTPGETRDYYGWDGTRWLNDIDYGGENNVEGIGKFDGSNYWFEFRKKLNSGDGFDWQLAPGDLVGNPNAPAESPHFMVGIVDRSARSTYEQYIALQLSDADLDGDGIYNEVDSQPDLISYEFSDINLGGSTSGIIMSKGDQILQVVDEPNPNGVRITASTSSGPQPALITVCGGASQLTLSAGDDVLVTCDSVTLQVLRGNIAVIFISNEGSNISAILLPGDQLTFDPVTFTFVVVEPNQNPISVSINDTNILFKPGVVTKFVSIDIKPGSDSNTFNNDGNGVLPVAIFGGPDFDVSKVDPATISLNGQAVRVVGKGILLVHREDVNGDLLMDLITQIQDLDSAFALGSTYAVLSAQTYDGWQIFGVDSICIVP